MRTPPAMTETTPPVTPMNEAATNPNAMPDNPYRDL
jgi:hypothetical protein